MVAAIANSARQPLAALAAPSVAFYTTNGHLDKGHVGRSRLTFPTGTRWRGDFNPSTTPQPSALLCPPPNSQHHLQNHQFHRYSPHWRSLSFQPSLPFSGLFLPLSHPFQVRTRTLPTFTLRTHSSRLLRSRNLNTVVGPKTNLEPSVNTNQRRSPFHSWNCGCCFPLSHSRNPPHSGHRSTSILPPVSITNRQILPPTLETGTATTTPRFISLQQSFSSAKPTRFYLHP